MVDVLAVGFEGIAYFYSFHLVLYSGGVAAFGASQKGVFWYLFLKLSFALVEGGGSELELLEFIVEVHSLEFAMFFVVAFGLGHGPVLHLLGERQLLHFAADSFLFLF